MAYVIGVLLARGVSVYASDVRLGRDDAFYAIVLLVIASDKRSSLHRPLCR
jgi:hypothetical protein